MSEERVALVTGAARGIGAATVRRLVAEGIRTVALDWCVGDSSPVAYAQSTSDELLALAASFPREMVEAVPGDVRDPVALAHAVDVALARWGRLDIAVAAAAVMAGGAPLWEEERLPLLWDIDVHGVWHTAAAAIPVMLDGPDPAGCRFVAVASTAGEHGLFRLSAYTTVKHAVIGLVRGLAADLVGTGVTAVAVSPGATETAMLTATAELYGVEANDLGAHQLLQRRLAPDEVAAAIAFACSREGAVLNGSVVHADGGFVG